MTVIGWVDLSNEYRQKIGTILELLQPEGVVDELGIGTIRDAIANRFFPGISTIQTKAKYFFIVPYILFDYQKETQYGRKTPIQKYLYDQEHDIMWELAEKYEYKRGCGVIGITKKRRQYLMRRPSEIYWNGLNTFGIITAEGLSITAYLKRYKHYMDESRRSQMNGVDEGQSDDPDAEFEGRNGIEIPYDPDWRKDLSLDLSQAEADILRIRIIDSVGECLLTELLSNKKLFRIFNNARDYMEFVKIAISSYEIKDQLKDKLILGHDFSELIHGAHIIYNYSLQKKVFNSDCWFDEWKKWIRQLKNVMIDYSNFDPRILFNYPYSSTTKSHTQEFIVGFWEALKNNIKSIEEFEQLICLQEYRTKGNKARLKLDNREEVKNGGWIGMGRLHYRYNNAKIILNDIYQGLGV